MYIIRLRYNPSYMQTKKAIGFKSLRLNVWNITQIDIKIRNVNYSSKILTYYLIQSYLLKR